MDNNNDFATSKGLIERSQELNQASIEVLSAERPQNIFRVTFDLSKAKGIDSAVKINRAFKSLFIETCTDPSAKVNMRPITDSSEQDYVALGYKDSWGVSTSIPRAFFHWDQQIGFITVVFFSDSDFRSGSQVSLTSGGVSISEGSSIRGPLHVNLVASAAAVIIAPQNLFRKVAIIQNKTGSDIFIGSDSTVNSLSNEGIKVADGANILWKNTGALYAFSNVGGKVTRIEEE